MKPRYLLLLGIFMAQGAGAAEPGSPPPLLDVAIRENRVALTADDRQNGAWILQTSTNLQNWVDVGPSFHIRNRLQPLSPGPKYEIPSGKRYFRMIAASSTPAATKEQMLNLPATPYPYSALAKQSLVSARLSSRASINDAKAELGRVLFYDRRLSKDNSISCASCHRQEDSFADSGVLSTGHRGGLSRRNSVAPLEVLGYSTDPKIFWDGRSKSLELAVLEPIADSVEMGMPLDDLVKKLDQEPYYAGLFEGAFASPGITKERIGAALADFLEALPRFNSRYDLMMTGRLTASTGLTASEKAGYSLYQSRCISCHAPNSSKTRFENNGLEMEYKDPGMGGVTGLATDNGKFKAPSLRQISQTAPYMHDGRFKTLREVINHYSEGMVNHPNLALELKSRGPMHLTETQKQDLETFLKMLTDEEVATNPAFSDPFRKD